MCVCVLTKASLSTVYWIVEQRGKREREREEGEEKTATAGKGTGVEELRRGRLAEMIAGPQARFFFLFVVKG